MTLVDNLTRLLDRQGFDRALSSHSEHATLFGSPLSLLIIDVDKLQEHNYCFGHSSGDECLCKIADAIRDSLLGSTATAARFGGDEFVVILPDANFEQSLFFADSLRLAVERLGISRCYEDEAVITISIGVSTAVNQTDPDELVAQADRALYRAKLAGRNCVRK